jgi:site-specific DNA-methyltransferase (adenine-specific)
MIEIKIGDCTQRLKDLEDNSVDAVICDPPYGLKFMSKGWDDIGNGSQQREWHRGWLKEAHRILKPNGVIKAFSGSRTFHHLIAMMEEIGFGGLSVEAWSYGSGFPKSHNVSKSIDKHLGVVREEVGVVKGMGKQNPEWNGTAQGRSENYFKPEYILTAPTSQLAKQYEGWGTALKPAWESICIGIKK